MFQQKVCISLQRGDIDVRPSHTKSLLFFYFFECPTRFAYFFEPLHLLLKNCALASTFGWAYVCIDVCMLAFSCIFASFLYASMYEGVCALIVELSLCMSFCSKQCLARRPRGQGVEAERRLLRALRRRSEERTGRVNCEIWTCGLWDSKWSMRSVEGSQVCGVTHACMYVCMWCAYVSMCLCTISMISSRFFTWLDWLFFVPGSWKLCIHFRIIFTIIVCVFQYHIK